MLIPFCGELRGLEKSSDLNQIYLIFKAVHFPLHHYTYNTHTPKYTYVSICICMNFSLDTGTTWQMICLAEFFQGHTSRGHHITDYTILIGDPSKIPNYVGETHKLSFS